MPSQGVRGAAGREGRSQGAGMACWRGSRQRRHRLSLPGWFAVGSPGHRCLVRACYLLGNREVVG